MAVLIDMEMPRSCDNCVLKSDGFCNITNNMIRYDEDTRDEDCPLMDTVEIPDAVSRQEAIDAVYKSSGTGTALKALKALPSAQSEITNRYNLKKIYNIYAKIAQAHFVYQPSKPKSITAMPFDWLETQNLLEKYLEDHGADFDALCGEYVSENVKDDRLPSTQPDIKHIIFETLSECGIYGEEATIKFIGTLKRLGRSDLLPPCVR